MRSYLALACFVFVSACAPSKRSPDFLQPYQSRTLHTCCNIRYEKADVSDANYHVGTILAAGTPVTVVGGGRDSVTVDAGTTRLNLIQQYGGQQESLEQYMNKMLVTDDPQRRVAAYPGDVREAIREGRVERGMTREQVILSLGYPPTHRTPSLDSVEWLYWYNRWLTFKVVFDEKGVVSHLIGGNALTKNVPIVAEKPRAAAKKKAPAAKPKKKR